MIMSFAWFTECSAYSADAAIGKQLVSSITTRPIYGFSHPMANRADVGPPPPNETLVFGNHKFTFAHCSVSKLHMYDVLRLWPRAMILCYCPVRVGPSPVEGGGATTELLLFRVLSSGPAKGSDLSVLRTYRPRPEILKNLSPVGVRISQNLFPL
jgi:hypothetical protein